MVPLLEGKDWVRTPVIHHSANGTFFLRDGKWKMVFSNGSGGREKPVGKPFQKPYSLFNLENDPSERTNLIDVHPDIAEQLEKKLAQIRQHRASRAM